MEERTPLRNSMPPSVQKKLDILVANNDIKYKDEYLEMLGDKKNGECGCEYCKDDKEFICNNDDFSIEVSEKELNIFFSTGNQYENYSGSTAIEINYCPMCGRKLI